jgi:RND family efflux transporter MFP subunit
MRLYFSIWTISLLALLAVGCDSGGGDDVASKKARLEKLKAESMETAGEIRTLEEEIGKMDPEFFKQNKKSILITTKQAEKRAFEHFVEVTGSVLSKKNVSISAQTAGTVLEVPAVEGMRVQKGQLLAKIDAETIRLNIDELKTSLNLSTILFEKQSRLWDQKIGTEVQFLEAKNRKESAEKSLASANSQLDKAYVKAPFSGTVESVNIRLGELVQPGTSLIQFVGDSDLFIEADISERYIGVMQKGDSVYVNFPSIDHELYTKVSSVGGIINANNRTFKVEVYLPNTKEVKPNMIAVLKIKDYETEASVIVPSYLILSDNKGDYIFIVKDEVVQKKYVTRGKTYDNQTEILSGLEGNEVLVDKGFREVGDNFTVKISTE